MSKDVIMLEGSNPYQDELIAHAFEIPSLSGRKYRITADTREDAEFLFHQFLGVMGCLNKIQLQHNGNWNHFPNYDNFLYLLQQCWEHGVEFDKRGNKIDTSIKRIE